MAVLYEYWIEPSFAFSASATTLRAFPLNAFSSNLFVQCLIPAVEVCDHGLLLTVDPSSKDRKEELRRETRLALPKHKRFLPRP